MVVGLLACGEQAPGDPRTNPIEGPPAGNGDGTCTVPVAAQEEDISKPDTVIGDGTATSCTADAFIDAVARGGVITFNCGPEPVIITLDRTAKIFNDQNPDIVIDGGGKVTLSGGGRVRILYMNTCDRAQVWTTPHCQNQDHPRLTIQRLTFTRGDCTFELTHGRGETDDHTWTWIPERKLLAPGDLFIWAVPNGGNPQKVQRYPIEWAAALRSSRPRAM